MKKIIAIITTLIITLISSYALADGWETWYVSAHSGLNCRTAPTVDSEILTTYPNGAELQIIGADGIWWESFDGNIQGWVHSDYLTDKPFTSSTASGSPSPQGEGSRGGMMYFGKMYITEYTPDPAENGGASVDCDGDALAPQVGDIVAVDPRVIPKGKLIYIEGVGYRKTKDTGVYGDVVDVLSWGDSGITGHRDVWLVE